MNEPLEGILLEKVAQSAENTAKHIRAHCQDIEDSGEFNELTMATTRANMEARASDWERFASELRLKKNVNW